MDCRKCLQSIPDGASFCPWCGAKQTRSITKRKSGNGLGYVYKRGSTYTLRMRTYIAIKDEIGTPHTKCRELTKGGFKTKKEALEYRDSLKGESVKKEKMTLAAYWMIYERDRLPLLSHAKQVNYNTAFKRIAPIQYRDISMLTVSDLQNVVSTATVSFYPANDMKAVLNKLFYMAAADGIASKDLPSFITLPPNQETEREAFSIDEVDRIASAWENGVIFAGYILLMIYTSMMPGELLKLKKSMIDLEGQRIIGAGIKTKQRKTQSIVFPAFLTPVIEKLMKQNPSDSFLPDYYYEKFSNEYKSTLRAAGCRELTPYSCRHTTATVLSLDPTVAPALISRIMRHSARMTERYTHPDDTAAIQAINKMHPIK
ncbi:MAG: tyrosine-type recombinase/integrase [Eubacteriales bacterium]|nr:tyrosine-type recombinase/integrase [Eubacteriales bacterium]